MTGRLPVLAATLALGLAASSAAQISPGSSGFPGIRSASQEEYWFSMRELGRCLVSFKHAQSIQWMKTPVDSPAEKKLVDAMYASKGTSCLRDMYSMGVIRSMVRGSVAEALYKTSGLQGAVPPAPASHPFDSTNIKSLGDFALCYAVTHPNETRTLLMTTGLGSVAEKAEMARLSPGFAECVPAGIELKLSPQPLRAAFAEAMYHVTNDASTPAVAGIR